MRQRNLRWWHYLPLLLFVAVIPIGVVYASVPHGTPVHSAIEWYFALTFWPGPIILLSLALVGYLVRHNLLHRRIREGKLAGPCPWCYERDVWLDISTADWQVRRERRERLTREELGRR